jgi:GGDEF domain-containing protein
MRSNLWSFDTIVRYGGDEFVCGLGGIDPESAECRFGAIDQALRDPVGVGITVGPAPPLPNDTLDKLISRADTALLDVRKRCDELLELTRPRARQVAKPVDGDGFHTAGRESVATQDREGAGRAAAG